MTSIECRGVGDRATVRPLGAVRRPVEREGACAPPAYEEALDAV
jgi:hypothetical protein